MTQPVFSHPHSTIFKICFQIYNEKEWTVDNLVVYSAVHTWKSLEFVWNYNVGAYWRGVIINTLLLFNYIKIFIKKTYSKSYLKNNIDSAIRMQQAPIHGDFLSPIRAHFQKVPITLNILRALLHCNIYISILLTQLYFCP